MQINICLAKIHRATVTEADLNYVGSITIDRNLLKASGMRPFQMVQITNCSNAVLWRTYIMEGKAGSGTICLNGPPARLFAVGDQVIILADISVTPEEYSKIRPKVVFVDSKNKVKKIVRHKLSPLTKLEF